VAEDIQIIKGTPAKLAARLCNFETAKDYPLGTHVAWLDKNVPAAIKDLQGPWVDLIGFASRIGNFEFNRDLSLRRCESVKRYVSNYSDRMRFQIVWGKGESESGDDENDNSGYYRAVEIYIYGFQPPKLVPPPSPKQGSKQFRMRLVGGVSTAPPAFKGVQGDNYYLQFVDVAERTAAFYTYVGVGVAVPTIIPTPPTAVSAGGPFSSFRIIGDENLKSFEGAAQLYQDPGISIGPASAGGTFRLAINSATIVKHGSLVIPHIVPFSSDRGLGAGLGSATAGTLKIMGDVVPFTG